MIQPEKLDETFRIGMQHHVSAVLFPALYKKINSVSPHVKIKQSIVSDISEMSSKELNQYDFIIGTFPETPNNYTKEAFFTDHFVCLSGVKKLNRQKMISISDLNNYEHVILSYLNNYTKTLNDSMLVSNDVHRKYKIICDDPFMAAQLTAEQQLLLIATKTRADFFKKIFGLKVFDLPFESPSINNNIFYKKIDGDNPAKQWFKSVLMKLDR